MYFPPRLIQVFYFLSDFCYARLPARRPANALLREVKVIAHRGKTGNDCLLENTLDAFDASLAAGVDGIEFDVRWTSDDVPVVIHDADCQRVFKQPIEIGRCQFADLRRQIPAIPTLLEVVTRFSHRCHLMIELKDSARAQTPARYASLANVLAGLTPAADFHLLAFDTRCFDETKTFPSATFLPIAQIATKDLARQCLAKHWGGLTAHYALLSKSQIRELRACKLSVGTGQVDHRRIFYREVNRGVRWIFTNKPRTLLAIIKETLT